MFKKIIAIMVCVCFLFATIGCGGITKTPVQGEKAKLARVTEKGIFGGVCAGWAYFTGTPTWMWRAGFVFSCIVFGTGMIAYLLLWAFMPAFDKTPYDYDKRIE